MAVSLLLVTYNIKYKYCKQMFGHRLRLGVVQLTFYNFSEVKLHVEVERIEIFTSSSNL